MAVLPVLTEPDKRLRQKAARVARVDETIRKILQDMVDTMVAEDGIGLAATQVDIHQRLIVMHIPGEPGPLKLVNPAIVWQSPQTDCQEEGCLSVPGYTAAVKRSVEVHVSFLDECGHPHTTIFKGLGAVCIQHEMDHLEGILFIDYLSSLKRSILIKKLEKQKV